MLYINDSLPHIALAHQIHVKHITCYIKRKLYGNTKSSRCSDVTCSICTSRIGKIKGVPTIWIKAFEDIGIDKIVESPPKQLGALSKQFWNKVGTTYSKLSQARKLLFAKIIDYTDWASKPKNAKSRYSAYDLCNNLKISTCIYCNRLYTTTVITNKKSKERIIRPTLDHWYSQETYPLLALSFYNLIPSCSPCNSSVKHRMNFNLRNTIHPYIDQKITEDYQLVSTFDKTLNTFKITVDSNNSKVRSTLKRMKIKEIYEHHQSELADLDLLKRKYNKKYLTDLGSLLDKRLTQKDVYRVLFGVEYEDENFSNRPLSKLKRDILNLKIK
ncbi:hypothetical protein [Taibaiella chishuiensis]|uniref:HNH endonuclease n=1 Tax=Taibaiella chishuiensis TaxID=1434707 RepID=A0A2P8CY38_9BACT|nr:hypothetical protein [Taibaiella chishuiensis]PSK89890.1 hypothetical protein B0I18_110191 [Taibaiella chishuiensis]